MAGCPVCGSLFPTHLRITESGTRGLCRVCDSEWVEYPDVFVLKAGQCPCCGGLVLGAAIGMPARFADARRGDRYCPVCDVLIMREFAGDGTALTCPSHSSSLSTIPGDGPGASSRWAAASFA